MDFSGLFYHNLRSKGRERDQNVKNVQFGKSVDHLYIFNIHLLLFRLISEILFYISLACYDMPIFDCKIVRLCMGI
ncbi:hypothetical protein RIR_jg236.t1 [Rhizophagus irregularis DAOM 181602=DAOM 197198]|nr:hypothetical protein RIR_jg236.t1 [Rhizophagus irregularis DAOM 181602=DAOM 197198]